MSATTIYRYTITTPEKKNKEESILINLVKGKIIYLSISLQIIAMQIPTHDATLKKEISKKRKAIEEYNVVIQRKNMGHKYFIRLRS